MSWEKAFSIFTIFFASVFGAMAENGTATNALPAAPVKKQVLFVCTGNYYRSRFAEALFNEKAIEAYSNWRAASRGLKLEPSQHGISPFSRRELIRRGVPHQLWDGAPRALTAEDLKNSDRVILMDETEHRPLLEKEFPKCDERKIECWHIGEQSQMKPSEACNAMARNVARLLETVR